MTKVDFSLRTELVGSAMDPLICSLSHCAQRSPVVLKNTNSPLPSRSSQSGGEGGHNHENTDTRRERTTSMWKQSRRYEEAWRPLGEGLTSCTELTFLSQQRDQEEPACTNSGVCRLAGSTAVQEAQLCR